MKIKYSIDYEWKEGKKKYLAKTAKDEKLGYITLARVVHMPEFSASAYGVDGFPVHKIFYLSEIRVFEQYRRLGIGTALMQECIRWANISKNIITLDAIPLSEDVKAKDLIAFYRKLGFKSGRWSSALNYHDRPKAAKLCKAKNSSAS